MSSPESSPELDWTANYSVTDFSFRDDEADAIIKTIGWGSRWFDDMVIPTKQRESERGSGNAQGVRNHHGHAMNVVCAHLRTYNTAEISLHDLPGKYDKSGRTVFNVRKDITSLYLACKMAAVERYCHTFGRPSSALHLMACCCAPYYNIRTGRVIYGFCCAGCYKRYMDWELEDDTWLNSPAERWAHRAEARLHDRNSFLKHFKRCKEGQRLWALSDGGALVPAELPPSVEKHRLTE
ncbi:hypothetical protein MCOR23_001697 [Pyricularia oryzae]|nr:hypothetical protein MCOR19_002789 [Pyricularia oryzae]KAI6280227.1 hypothetical protein MCOR26_003820 [Pyricularia oryzae]KAI6407608.1 hypothetical protein MCOR23_001697 [Pyricularia oryzae]KAI6522148.1 hypothetical protein MCOR05_010381 [Pyricularia oryzae]KAI6553474.1 hypothetical protein MCOR04_010727 [Pyricularia oryzae]